MSVDRRRFLGLLATLPVVGPKLFETLGDRPPQPALPVKYTTRVKISEDLLEKLGGRCRATLPGGERCPNRARHGGRCRLHGADDELERLIREYTDAAMERELAQQRRILDSMADIEPAEGGRYFETAVSW